MTVGRIGCVLAIVAVLCALTVFLFHTMQGPYSVVHGPATALLSVRAAAGLRMAIVQAGLSVAMGLTYALAMISWETGPYDDVQARGSSATFDVILRC